jgi:glycosyltransferase involved in cell wall biosynthesis
VVVPFHNAARFLDETVASVLAQTYDRWELLLVDDGSTDGSTAIAERYAALHPERIRRVEHPGGANRGVSASRALGIAHARGELVAFLDADDVYLPGKLARQVPQLLARPEAGLLYGNTRYWRSWAGEGAGADTESPLGVPSHTLAAPPHLLTMYLRGTALVPCTCSLLIRRDAAIAVGGPEESFRGMYEDQAFYAKLMLRLPVLVVDECWDLYRQHEASMVAASQRARECRAVRTVYLDWLAAHVTASGVTDRALQRALAAERWWNRHPRVDTAVWRAKRLGRLARRLARGVARRLVRVAPRT